MSELRWKWCKVDKPGVWAYGGDDRNKPPKEYEFVSWSNGLLDGEAWRAYLGVPTILPPEPALRLPEGWTEGYCVSQSSQSHVVAAESPDGTREVRVWHPDKATAYHMAQAAVDAMEVKCESP